MVGIVPMQSALYIVIKFYIGKPFIIYVTKDEHKLVGLCLTDLGYTISKNLPADCHPV